MYWQFTPYVIPYVISAAVSLVLMLATAVWLLGNVVTLGSIGLPNVLFWDNVTWFGTVTVPAAWLAFVFQYTGRKRWLTCPVVLLLALEPLVTLLLVWTNSRYGLITSSITSRHSTRERMQSLSSSKDARIHEVAFFPYSIQVCTMCIG